MLAIDCDILSSNASKGCQNASGATVTKAPPSDNIPVPPETATEKTYPSPSAETSTTTSTTASTTTSTTPPTATTSTPEKFEALVAESTTPEDNKTATAATTATTTTNKPTTTNRQQESTNAPTARAKSPETTTTTAANGSSAAETEKTVADSPTTTTTSIKSTTTSPDTYAPTPKERLETSSQSTATEVRSTETSSPNSTANPTVYTSTTTQTQPAVEESTKNRTQTETATTQPGTTQPEIRATSQPTTKTDAATPQPIATTKRQENTTVFGETTEQATEFIPFTLLPDDPDAPGGLQYRTEPSITSEKDFEHVPETDTTLDEIEDIVVTHNKKTVTIRNGFKTICEPNNITVLVDKAVIGKYEKQYGPLHLNDDDMDQECRGVEYERYYRYTIAPNILGCGTQFVVNDTHVNFTNTVSNRRLHEAWYDGLLDPTGMIFVGRSNLKPFPLVHMNIYCTFPIEMTVHTDLIPDLRLEVKTFNVSGKGQFSAVMQLFKDTQYSQPHFGAPSLAPDDLLRVGVTLLETKDENISIAVRKCWATPVRQFDFEQFYPLIDDYCPLEEALKGNVSILENGKSKRARWEGPVFRFVKYTQVWLHCELKVCFGETCNKTCDGKDLNRAKRSLNPDDVLEHMRSKAVVSAGPVFVKPTERPKQLTPSTTHKPSESTKTLDETTVLIIVIVLSSVILISCILFVVLITRCRKRLAGKDSTSATAQDTSHIIRGSLSSVGDVTISPGSVHATLSRYHSVDVTWETETHQREAPVPDLVSGAELPPVPCFVEGGRFPESYRVIEDGCTEARVCATFKPSADAGRKFSTDKSYPNPAFDNSGENR